MLVNAPPCALTCHFTEGVGVPLAAAVNVTVTPAGTLCTSGWVVMIGPEFVTAPGVKSTSTFWDPSVTIEGDELAWRTNDSAPCG